MKIKNIIDEDFVNYKLPSMFIITTKCNFKCCKEANIPVTVCQNRSLAQLPDIEISVDEIFHRYISNPISEAIVFGGLEPLMQSEDIIEVISYFRRHGCNDDIVIYTGYYEKEIKNFTERIKPFGNIILKTGRYIPNQKPHYDDILGVNLISDNQKGVRIC